MAEPRRQLQSCGVHEVTENVRNEVLAKTHRVHSPKDEHIDFELDTHLAIPIERNDLRKQKRMHHWKNSEAFRPWRKQAYVITLVTDYRRVFLLQWDGPCTNYFRDTFPEKFGLDWQCTSHTSQEEWRRSVTNCGRRDVAQISRTISGSCCMDHGTDLYGENVVDCDNILSCAFYLDDGLITGTQSVFSCAARFFYSEQCKQDRKFLELAKEPRLVSYPTPTNGTRIILYRPTTIARGGHESLRISHSLCKANGTSIQGKGD